ncbi:MAG: hypothetical protein Q9191_007592 [Dirinaria sp. TL-2023a]
MTAATTSTVSSGTLTVVTTTTPAPAVITTTAAQSSATVTGSPTTVTVSSTTTSYRVLPTLCDPKNFKDYRNFVDSRPFSYKTVPGTTKQDCCLTCYNAKNCMSFIFNDKNQQCNYYVGTTQTTFTYRVDVCPLGITSGSYEQAPGWATLPDNYGPCLDGAPY